jgi:hypothetical protein
MRYHLPFIFFFKNPTFLERENRKETRIKRVYTKKLKRNLVGEVRKSEGAESDNK